MFRRKSPVEYWDESPSGVGWSVFDGELAEVRGIRKGKRLQLRLTRDGSFPFPLGVLPESQVELLESGLLVEAPEVVDVVSGGTRVAASLWEVFGVWTVNSRHASVILYRIAHGMLYPYWELVETLSGVPGINAKLERIDVERVRAKLSLDRVPTAEEFEETHGEYLRREADLASIMDVYESDDSTVEMIEAATVSLEEHADNDPFNLDGAPYLK